MSNNGLNQFERDVKDYTGLSIPKFSHLRNMVKCCDCDKWFRASKYLHKEMIQEDKDADAFETARIHPNILCGKCGRTYLTKKDELDITPPNAVITIPFQELKIPNYRKISKRRLKIMNIRRIEREERKEREEW